MGEATGPRQLVLRSIDAGGRTFQIAMRLGWNTPRARYYLIQLERAGKVVRDERYSADNDIYWLPTPPAGDLTS